MTLINVLGSRHEQIKNLIKNSLYLLFYRYVCIYITHFNILNNLF